MKLVEFIEYLPLTSSDMKNEIKVRLYNGIKSDVKEMVISDAIETYGELRVHCLHRYDSYNNLNRLVISLKTEDYNN